MQLIEVGQDPIAPECRESYDCPCARCQSCAPRGVDGGTFWLAVAMLLGAFVWGVVVGFAIGRIGG